MSDAMECLKAATRLIDPRFCYIPAAETNIAATWMRFGFDPRANQLRRERLRASRQPLVPAMMNSDEESPAIRGRLQSY